MVLPADLHRTNRMLAFLYLLVYGTHVMHVSAPRICPQPIGCVISYVFVVWYFVFCMSFFLFLSVFG